ALAGKAGKEVFLVADDCHPQTISVVQTRAAARGLTVHVLPYEKFEFGPQVFGALVQYPATDGAIRDYSSICDDAHAHDALVTVAADLLSLVLLSPPGEWSASTSHGIADTRATHSSREGNQQHLHSAGPARSRRKHVRGVPRSGGTRA